MSRSFDRGSNKYLEVGAAVASTTPMTMFSWYYTTDATTEQILMTVFSSGSNHRHQINVATQFSALYATSYQEGAGSSTATATVAPTINTWQNACAVFAASNDRRIYLNGGSKGTNTGSRTVSSLNSTSIGIIRGYATFNGFIGQIAHPAIWNVALDDNEVAMLGAGISPLRVRPQSLVMYLPYLGRNGPEIDISGGRTLAVTGATASSNEPRFFWPSRRRTIYLDTVNNVRDATDFATITDALIESSFRNRAASESASLADALIESSFRNRAAFESSTLVDAFIDSRLRGRLSSEGSTIEDAVLESSFRNRDSLEGATLADFVLESSFRNRASSESISNVADAILLSASRSRIAADGIVALDEALRSILRTRLVGDFSTLIDEFISTVTTSGPTIYAFTATETLTLIDLAIEQLSLSRVSSDALVAEDALILSALRRRIISEAATATDELLRQVTRNRILLDAAILVDASISSAQRNRTSSESASITDQSLTSRQANRTASESVAIAEVVARSLSRAIFTSDLLTVADATLLVRQMSAQVSEALSISEIIAKSLILSSYFDVRVLLGTLARNSETVLGSSESISLSASDGPTLGSYS